MSGHTIDWPAVRSGLAGLDVTDDPQVVTTKSRDFYWYSPILTKRLDACRADLVVTPRDEAELSQVLSLAAEHSVPVTVRGAGTGNYGQAMPLCGGLVVETTRLNRVLAIGDGWVRAQTGIRLEPLDQACRETGQELLMFPSTKRSATLGGFIAGGSAGIGSVRHGMLKDPGVMRRVRVLTCETEPRSIELEGADIQQVHHAYGTNGVIVDLEVGLAPATPWVQCLTVADDYLTTVRIAKAVDAAGVVTQLLSTIDAPIVHCMKPLRGKLPAGKALLLAIVASDALPEYERLVADHNAETPLCGDEQELRRHGLPAITEFSYNHATLQVMKVDKSVTYLQTLFPAPIDEEKIAKAMERFGDELLWHHEYVRYAGELVAFAIQVVRYKSPERLAELINEIEAMGLPVFNPHTHVIEEGGMKQVDPRHLAFKRIADPLGLMNPGKTRAWDGPGPRPTI